MSAAKSHLTLAQAFGQRVREARERRGWSQGELAKRLRIDRTTLNKIERGSRGDVSISQLFAFATVLGIAPVYLLTPQSDGPEVELTVGGPVVSPADARQWIRGEPPEEFDAWREWLLDLPRDEQRQQLAAVSALMHGARDALTFSLVAGEIEKDVSRWLRSLDRKEQNDA